VYQCAIGAHNRAGESDLAASLAPSVSSAARFSSGCRILLRSWDNLSRATPWGAAVSKKVMVLVLLDAQKSCFLYFLGHIEQGSLACLAA